MPTEDELKLLAGQLAKPEGELGLEVARDLHLTNFGMTQSALRTLNLDRGDQILEIGHGNAAHLKFLLGLMSEISYTGLEISETMQEEAKSLNSELAKEGMIRFCHYKGELIPFSDSSFTKIFTVNTVYFWTNPKDFAAEIRRVLHPSGKFVLAFVQKEFMKELPFSKFGFKLYDTDDLIDILEKSGMIVETAVNFEEMIQTKSGQKMPRQYTVLRCSAKKWGRTEHGQRGVH